jgi:hypothetical protein
LTKEGSKPAINDEKPKTSVRFRFHDGNTSILDVNLDHTVQDLIDYVNSVAPTKGHKLLAGFPPRPLENPSLTIEEAKL